MLSNLKGVAFQGRLSDAGDALHGRVAKMKDHLAKNLSEFKTRMKPCKDGFRP